MANLALKSSASVRYQSAVALVIVLWFIVLLTIIAGSFALTMRRESGMVRNSRDEAVSGALADGGLYFSMMMLEQQNKDNRWRSDGTVYEIPFGGGQVRIQIYDEVGKFDLNKADATVLKSVFSRTGSDDEQAESLADAILDWRDKDDLTHLKGAEKEDYEDAGRSYGPRNKPFQTLEELALVLGVNYQIYRGVRPLVTVYSSQSGIDPLTASKEALLALPNVDETTVENFLLERSENQAQSSVFQGIEGVNTNSGGQKDKIYSIRAEARISDDSVTAVSAIVERKETLSGEPFSILQWDRYPVGKESLFTSVDIEQVQGLVTGEGKSLKSKSGKKSGSRTSNSGTRQENADETIENLF